MVTVNRPHMSVSTAASLEHAPEHPPPFSYHFRDKDHHMDIARSLYIKILGGGCFALIIAIFAVFSIFWGALWKTPAHNLSGWIVDFDESLIGSTVTQGLSSFDTKITWTIMPSSDFSGPSEVAERILGEKAWVAVIINPNATALLNAAAASADPSYNGSDAITVYGVEARSENAFRSLIRPIVQGSLTAISQQFALAFAKQLAPSSSVASILSSAPQIITQPISYTLDNLRPFDTPVATAITFVGLIYLLILTFFIVMIGLSAREISGLDKHLTIVSLVKLRLVSTFIAYFFISLFYSLLSLAFQADFSRTYGRAGFLIFWMLNWVGMLSVGLALEAMMTLLTVRFVPFFMIIWIITNVSVCSLPIEVLPKIYRYGYAMPFYNVSRAVRSILFGTKNNLGMNFGILIGWFVLSCITLTLAQTFRRRHAVSELRNFEMDKRVED